MTWHRPGFLKNASFLKGFVHSPRTPERRQTDERAEIARHDTGGLTPRTRPATTSPSADLPPRAAPPRTQVASSSSVHGPTSTQGTPTVARLTASSAPKSVSGPSRQEDPQVQARCAQIAATSTLLDKQGQPASKETSRALDVELGEFNAPRDDLRRRIEASPPSSDRDEALFICDELGKYPCYPGEKLCVSKDSANCTNGLLKLGIPVLVESFGIPPSVSVQQVVTYPTRQGAGRTLMVRAVNHSEAEKCGGNIRAAHNVGSEDFYERMGFEQIGPMWVLRPSTRPDLWEKTPSDEWRFKG